MSHTWVARMLLAGAVCCLVQLWTAAHARAQPGEIIRVWPLEGGAPDGARAYRIRYRSIGFRGDPIEVSGAIVFPSGPVPPGGRNIIAWAHPTTGVVDRCAPTLLPGFASRIAGLEEMLQRGYVVAATDYEGLGTPGMHPYLIGVSEARAVLDSVRAARQLQDVGATRRFAVWGHSQGGHAALYTGEIAASYAPELELVGVAAAAPATYLADLFEADRKTSAGRALTAMTILSWSRLYGLPIQQVVDPRAMGAFRRVANDCIETVSDLLNIQQAVMGLDPVFLRGNPTKLPAWRAIMDQNTPGRASIRVPVFIAQGTADDVVPARITRRFVSRLCRNGTRVTVFSMPGVSHGFAALNSRVAAVSWMTDRFRGRRAPNDC
jgi:acetyl esterase/lipase